MPAPAHAPNVPSLLTKVLFQTTGNDTLSQSGKKLPPVSRWRIAGSGTPGQQSFDKDELLLDVLDDDAGEDEDEEEKVEELDEPVELDDDGTGWLSHMYTAKSGRPFS